MVTFNLLCIVITAKLFIIIFNTSLFWITLYCFNINNAVMDIIKCHFSPHLDYFLRKISKQIYYPSTHLCFLFWHIMPNTNSKELYHCTMKALPSLNFRMFIATR